jgi:hypothetical protein
MEAKNTNIIVDVENFEFSFFEPTAMLKWKSKIIDLGDGTGETNLVLHQLWIDNFGKEEWREIPIE